MSVERQLKFQAQAPAILNYLGSGSTSLTKTVLGIKEKHIFIEIIVIFSFFTGRKPQRIERKHYFDGSELYESLIKNNKKKI